MYFVGYVAIALTILQSVHTNALFRRGECERARRCDRVCRWLFPALVVGAVPFSAARSVKLGRG